MELGNRLVHRFKWNELRASRDGEPLYSDNRFAAEVAQVRDEAGFGKDVFHVDGEGV